MEHRQMYIIDYSGSLLESTDRLVSASRLGSIVSTVWLERGPCESTRDEALSLQSQLVWSWGRYIAQIDQDNRQKEPTDLSQFRVFWAIISTVWLSPSASEGTRDKALGVQSQLDRSWGRYIAQIIQDNHQREPTDLSQFRVFW